MSRYITTGWCLNAWFCAWCYQNAPPATPAELMTLRFSGTVSCIAGIIGIIGILIKPQKVK